MTDKFKWLQDVVTRGLGLALFFFVLVPQGDPLLAMLLIIGSYVLAEFVVMTCIKIAGAAISKAKGEK